MATRPNPLVPLGLFRSRAFATVNLATFFVYGALYVTFGYQPLVLQGVLGYTALGAGLIGLPSGILLSRPLDPGRDGGGPGRGPPVPGRRSADHGRRAALVRAAPGGFGPVAGLDRVTDTLIPPLDVLVDVLPAIILFGIGISLVVAPLTSTLMGSIPGRFSGIGSAINNAISRVGQPLLGAIIFIAISATFYSALATSAPALDTDVAGRPERVPAAQPAAGSMPRPPRSRGGHAGLDGRVPPCDPGVRRAPGDRHRRVLVRAAVRPVAKRVRSGAGDRAGLGNGRPPSVSRGPGTIRRGRG